MAATDEFADLERARELLDHATRLQYEAKHLIMAAITKRPSPQGQTSAPITSTVPGISTQPNFTLQQSVFRNPDPIRMMELRLEKERIREDIIAAEILRRRELEAEVRRELKLERELAMKTAPAEGLGTMRFAAHKNSVFEPFSFGTMPLSKPVTNGFKSPSTAFDSFSLPLLMSEPVINGFMSSPPLLPPPSNLGNKNKLILLEKPNPNLCGGKRKTPLTVGASELPPFGLKKKPREEWTCTLCQVSETTEKGLIQHINSKKHKAKEAELRAQQLDKSSRNAPSTQFSKPKETNGITSSKLEAKQVRESLLDHNETGDGSGQKLPDQGTSKKDKEEPSMPEDQCGGDLKNKDKVETADGLERSEDVAKHSRFKFWCEICQKGANNTKVMSQHMRGKKHNARSQKVTLKNVSGASSMVSAEASKKSEDADAANEAHEKFNAIIAELMRAHNAVLAKETENTAEIIVANSDKPAKYNLSSASSMASAEASKEAGDADAAKEAHVKLNALTTELIRTHNVDLSKEPFVYRSNQPTVRST